MKFLDPDDPFFRNPLIRIACVVIPLAWAGVEFWWSEPFWGILFAALGGYAAWKLFIERR